MRKGITPVVATILLISVTFAAAGTLYTVVQENIDEGKEAANKDLPLNINALEVETCYRESGRTYMVVRSSAQGALNASKMTLLLNGSIESESDYRIQPNTVNSQESFTVNMSQSFGDDTLIQITNGGQSLEYSCYNLN